MLKHLEVNNQGVCNLISNHSANDSNIRYQRRQRVKVKQMWQMQQRVKVNGMYIFIELGLKSVHLTSLKLEVKTENKI